MILISSSIPETVILNFSASFLQQHGSSAAAEMEVERLKQECKRALQMVKQWKQMYDNLHEFCVNELLNGDKVEDNK